MVDKTYPFPLAGNLTQNMKKKEGKQISRSLRIILWILMPVLFITALFLGASGTGPEIIPIAMGFLAIIDLIVLFIISERFYNWPIVFFLFFFAGLYFRRNHWPGAGILLTISLSFLSATSVINSVRFIISMVKNPFLRWFGSISCLIIAIYLVGWLFKLQHWSPTIANSLGYTGLFLYAVSVTGMVFLLPGSNYITWSGADRKIFYRAILMPMIVVFGLIIISTVFPQALLWIMDRTNPYWDVNKSFSLHSLEGLQLLH